MEKYIFLDVDGVLNCQDTYIKYGRAKHESLLDLAMVNRLVGIVEATEAKIVISSSWRLSSRSMDDLLSCFYKFGLRIYGITPDNFSNRGQQIEEWLLAHHKGETVRLIILDDDIIEDNMQSYQIKTKWVIGLQDGHMKEAIHALLGDEDNDRCKYNYTCKNI